MEPEKRANKLENERQSLITEYLKKQEQAEHIEVPNFSEDEEEAKLHKKTYEVSRKKWELKEEQELLGIKESEIKYDEMELDNLARKNRLRICRRNREKMEKELKDLYVEQRNIERDIDGVDEEEKITKQITVETKIESIEYDIEEMCTTDIWKLSILRGIATYRDLLHFILEVNALFCFANGNGSLEVREYLSADVPPDDVIDYDRRFMDSSFSWSGLWLIAGILSTYGL